MGNSALNIVMVMVMVMMVMVVGRVNTVIVPVEWSVMDPRRNRSGKAPNLSHNE